jgi:hypothetical protein
LGADPRPQRDVLPSVVMVQLGLESLPARSERVLARGIERGPALHRPVRCSRSRRSASWMTYVMIVLSEIPVTISTSLLSGPPVGLS